MITEIIIKNLLINRRFHCICYPEAAAFRMDYAQRNVLLWISLHNNMYRSACTRPVFLWDGRWWSFPSYFCEKRIIFPSAGRSPGYASPTTVIHFLRQRRALRVFWRQIDSVGPHDRGFCSCEKENGVRLMGEEEKCRFQWLNRRQEFIDQNERDIMNAVVFSRFKGDVPGKLI